MAAACLAADDELPTKFKITTKRKDDTVEVRAEKDRTVFSVKSPFGISQAVIERTDDRGPEAVVLWLHLMGLESFRASNGKVTLEADVRGPEIVIRVSDTGRGIPADKLSVIFEPFSQAEAPYTRSVGGVGIGLTLVQSLVRRLGGELGVFSEPGRGSSFTVRLPQPTGDGHAAHRREDMDRTARSRGTGSAGTAA